MIRVSRPSSNHPNHPHHDPLPHPKRHTLLLSTLPTDDDVFIIVARAQILKEGRVNMMMWSGVEYDDICITQQQKR